MDAQDAAREASVDLAQARRAKFVEGLFEEHGRDLVRWLERRFGPGPPDPEDVAQAAFAKLSGLKDVGHIRDPRAFLYTIAANSARSGLRWLQRTTAFIDGQLAGAELEVENITPERVHLSKARFEAMAAAAGRLTDKQRELVRRSRILGQTFAEIRAETGWSLGDMHRQLTAAMAVLEDAIAAYDNAPPQGETGDDR